MAYRRAAGAVLVSSLFFISCGDDKTPAGPTPSPTPVPAPTPTPTPTPTPAPSATPTPPPGEGTHEPAVFATAGVHSFRRNGTLHRQEAPYYLPADVIYLNCTPRDAEGNKTDNHGDIQGWNIYSKDLRAAAGPGLPGDFYYTDTKSFNPDLHINKPISQDGAIFATCDVQGIPVSRPHKMTILQQKPKK